MYCPTRDLAILTKLQQASETSVKLSANPHIRRPYFYTGARTVTH